LREYLNELVAEEGLPALVNKKLGRKDTKVLNERRRKLGCEGLEHSVVGLKSLYSRDEGIQEAVRKGKEIRLRQSRGETVDDAEVKPKQAISLENVVDMTRILKDSDMGSKGGKSAGYLDKL
jgi:hypothetical protein